MNCERWSRIGELFDAASNVPPAEREEWLGNACVNDESLRAEVEHLLAHDRQADQDGFLDHPEIANPEPQTTGDWPPANGRPAVAGPDVPRHAPMGPGDGTDGFSPKAAITSSHWQKSEEETRAIIQSRLRELPLIYFLIFGMMLLLRPVVLSSLPMAILAPFGILATTFAGIAILLSARAFSIAPLRRIELVMTVALAGLLVVYECRAIIGPTLEADRILAEKMWKNVILLVSLLMLIDAIYVPKGWRRAAIMSSLLAVLPVGT